MPWDMLGSLISVVFRITQNVLPVRRPTPPIPCHYLLLEDFLELHCWTRAPVFYVVAIPILLSDLHYGMRSLLLSPIIVTITW